MSPMTDATFWPGCNALPGAASTIPTHSMPMTRGNFTVGDPPLRVISSARLSPKALIRTSTQPSRGSGLGTSRICNTSGPPACSTTIAFIFHLPFTPNSSLCLLLYVHSSRGLCLCQLFGAWLTHLLPHKFSPKHPHHLHTVPTPS